MATPDFRPRRIRLLIGDLINDVLTHLADPHAFIEMCRVEAARDPSSKYARYYIEVAGIVERYIAEGVYKTTEPGGT